VAEYFLRPFNINMTQDANGHVNGKGNLIQRSFGISWERTEEKSTKKGGARSARSELEEKRNTARKEWGAQLAAAVEGEIPEDQLDVALDSTVKLKYGSAKKISYSEVDSDSEKRAQRRASARVRAVEEARTLAARESRESGLEEHWLSGGGVELRWLLEEVGAGALSGLFLRGGELVWCPRVGEEGYVPPVREQDDDGPAQVHPVGPKTLAARVTTSYFVTSLSAKGELTRPLYPADVCSYALELPGDMVNAQVLRGVTHTPLPRPDGTLLDTPGYDAQTGFLYLPSVRVPAVPSVPSAAALRRAVRSLRRVFGEFPWNSEHDFANFLGFLLTPLLRLVCPGPYKGALLNAHNPGSGKSLLGAALRIIHGGVLRGEMPPDEAELDKQIAAILLCTTGPVVEFDNVTSVLRSGRLASLLTMDQASVRVLGTTNNTQIENDRLWVFTGNNIQLGGDLPRRFVWCTIDPQEERPHERTGFAIPDLPGYLKEHRGEVLAWLLTLIRYWAADGMRSVAAGADAHGRHVGVVRAVLSTAGVPGVFDHQDSRVVTEAVDTEDWADLLKAAAAAFGARSWTVRQLLDEGGMAVVEALPGELRAKWDKVRYSGGAGSVAKSLGKWLANREGRYVSGMACRRAGKTTRDSAVLWRVEVVESRSKSG
jgi:hypothetical protein